MCEPISMGVLTAVSVGATIYGTSEQVKAQKDAAKAENKAAEYNAQLLDKNAAIQEQNAQLAEDRAREVEGRVTAEESASRKQYRGFRGSQRAAYAGSGVVVGEGSAGEVVGQTKISENADAMTIRSNNAKEAYALRMQGRDYTTEAEDQRLKAKFTRASKRDVNGRTAGTILSGVSNVASSLYGVARDFSK